MDHRQLLAILNERYSKELIGSLPAPILLPRTFEPVPRLPPLPEPSSNPLSTYSVRPYVVRGEWLKRFARTTTLET